MTRLTIVLGPGGVGKTTLAASMALACARRGERCAVVTVDPAKRLAQALGSEGLGHEPGAVAGEPNFFAATLDRPQAWDDMVARCAAAKGMPEAQVKRLLANRYYQHLRDELGGSAEIITSDYLAHLLEKGDFDHVVLDTPPAHDALGFLDAPKKFASFMDAKILELLIGGGGFRLSRTLVLKVLARLTGQQMLDDLIDFMRLSREVFVYMGERGREVQELQKQAQFILVTASDREGEVAAKNLIADLQRRQLELHSAFANRMVASPPPEEWSAKPDPAWKQFADNRTDVRRRQALRDAQRLQELQAQLGGISVHAIARLEREPQTLADLALIADQFPQFFGAKR
jgi:anion-transporting  ArsA/GET3 family ATPase